MFDRIITCPECKGSGEKTKTIRVLKREMTKIVSCSRCKGEGEIDTVQEAYFQLFKLGVFTFLLVLCLSVMILTLTMPSEGRDPRYALAGLFSLCVMCFDFALLFGVDPLESINTLRYVDKKHKPKRLLVEEDGDLLVIDESVTQQEATPHQAKQ